MIGLMKSVATRFVDRNLLWLSVLDDGQQATETKAFTELQVRSVRLTERLNRLEVEDEDGSGG